MAPGSRMDELNDSQRRTEGRREREFYRYFEAVRELSDVGPKYCDLTNPEAVKNFERVCSPDKALSAFCQLGALRLGCRRGLLFFFNVEHAYILAEATPTLSLQDTTKHNDELWLGYARIDRTQSVCDYTVRMAPTTSIESEPLSTIPLNIISDMREDTRICVLPYVVGEPYTRFYAGVPIKTEAGINIGAFCVLDDKVRPGLTTDEKTFLREMSITVMEHLESVQKQAYHKRGMEMVAALETFVQHCSDLRGSDRGPGEKSVRKKRRSHGMKDPPPPGTNSSGQGRQSSWQSKAVNGSITPDGDQGKMKQAAQLSSHSNEQGVPKFRNLLDQTDALSDELQAEVVPSSVKSTFENAAALLRKAVGVDALTFYDASIASFGGLAANGAEEDLSGTATTDSEIPKEPTKQVDLYAKPCYVLGESKSIEPEAADSNASPQPGITEPFLRNLLRRYPRGAVWTFDQYESSSSDELAPTKSGGNIELSEQQSGPEIVSKGSASRALSRRRSRREDGEVLQRLFPEARSLAILGLWDTVRSRWYAACVFWTSSPLRLFSSESEMNFVAAYCDVIMAEVHRLEVEKSDRAKGDFISSISHELRSPLHGILGGAEVLQDGELDELSHSMVSQIEVCGRTLLDIVDNLLDYANINFRAKRSRGSHGLSSEVKRSAGTDHSGNPSQALMSLDTDAALDEITEDVVESCVRSYLYGRMLDPDRSVTTVLDIEQPATGSWRCKLAVGGWKRVCMNLVTNALKYTRRGHIVVSLRSEDIGSGRFNAIFQVADTGKGMSEAFVRNELFAAFSQEDSLFEGTGLGMHIVARIVKSFGGNIDVQTDQIGAGTCITVTIPLEASKASHQTNPLHPTLAHFEGLPVGLLGHSAGRDSTTDVRSAQSLLLEKVAASCRRAGLRTVEIDDASNPRDTQFNVVTEYYLSEHILEGELQHRNVQSRLGTAPLIVLCNSTSSERQLRTLMSEAAPGHAVGYVVQPCGCRRLYATIRAVLEKSSATSPRTSRKQPAQHTDTTAGAANVFAVDSVVQDSSSTTNPPVPRPTLPDRTRSEQKPKRPPMASRASSGTKRPSSGLHLLLVEDNRINRQLLLTYANKQGHSCSTAENGEDAVKKYKLTCKPLSAAPNGEPGESYERRPQVILMDINMPVLNGFEATRQIRAFERQQGLEPAKIFALTGLGSADAQREAYISGCDLFLTKPVQLKELTNILKELTPGAQKASTS